VTTARTEGAAAGTSSATTAFASCFEQWKKRGIIVARFSEVSTFASSTTLVMQSRPSRSGSTTSGNSWTSSAAVFRKKADFESPSSRCRNEKRAVGVRGHPLAPQRPVRLAGAAA
jgi:hypothetical protein